MPIRVADERLLRHVIALRSVELEGGPDAIGDVREDLERLIGQTVSRALAARVLGISQTALDRHIDAGSLAVVVTPSGRRAVPLGELISLAVEKQDHEGARHPVAAALNQRRARAKRLAPRSLLPAPRGATDGHRRAELPSLAFHRAVAQRVDRQLVRDARRRLHRWRSDGRIDPRWAELWETLLAQPLEEIRRAISADDDDAADLRQPSPFAGTLSEPERRRIIEIVRQAA